MALKKKMPMTKEMEAQAAFLYGKHVSDEKALVLLLVTTAVCLLPICTGLRLWERIPALVETGIVRMDGQADPLPRPLLVFGVPALLCTLNLIIHIKLHLHQKKLQLPKMFLRLFDRWGFPILSTLAVNTLIAMTAGQPLAAPVIIAWLLALALLLLGSHMLNLTQDTSFIPAFFAKDGPVPESICRLAAYLWLTAGLGMLIFTSVTARAPVYFVAAAAVVFAIPLLPARAQRR